MSTTNHIYQFPDSTPEAFFDLGELKGDPNTYNHDPWVDRLAIDDQNLPIDAVRLAETEKAAGQTGDEHGQIAPKPELATYPEALSASQIKYVARAGKAIKAYRILLKTDSSPKLNETDFGLAA